LTPVAASVVTSLGYIRSAACTPVVQPADVDSNVLNIIDLADKASAHGADIVVFPELCITGYSCGDLFRQPDVLNAALGGIEKLRTWTTGRLPLLVVGAPLSVFSHTINAAIILHDGHVLGVIPKTYLPSTQEYYEPRWFTSADDLENVTEIKLCGRTVPLGTDIVVDLGHGAILSCELCEDLWSVIPPSTQTAQRGATICANLSASDDLVGKTDYRRSLVKSHSARTYMAYIYAGAGPWESTTDVVFSGHSMIAECGDVLAESSTLSLTSSMILADIDVQKIIADRNDATSFRQSSSGAPLRTLSVPLRRSLKEDVLRPLRPLPFVPADDHDRAERCREILRIQSTALAIRWKRSGAKKLVLGLSGGLDSTLAVIVSVLAADILSIDRSNIRCITLPGFGTTERTLSNARALAAALAVSLTEIDIRAAVRQHFADIGHDESNHSVVFENAQARERTQILMDVANADSGIVVGTGDLSEIALGWSTYNADHMSMYNVNAGVPKTLVRHLVDWYAVSVGHGTLRSVLLDILDTPVSPELLPPAADNTIAQHTESVLGPYDVHDFFLYHLIRLKQPLRTVVVLALLAFDGTYTPSDILRWAEIFIRRFVSQQFKRSAMPDGVKVGSVALSPRADWRMPSDASAAVWLRRLEELRKELAIPS